jgi:hypothetical protein
MGNENASWSIKVGNKTYGNPKLGDNWMTGEEGPEPWKNRPDWAARQVRGSEKGAVGRLWLVSIGTGLMFTLFLWHSHFPLFDHSMGPITYFFWIFPAVPILLVCKALWETFRLKRFGDPVLELTDVPIPLGGAVVGRISLGSNIDNAPEFTIQLACVHRVVTQGNKSSQVSEKVLWSGEKKASLMLGGILPVSIDVPPDQPSTNRRNLSDGILWRLTVQAPFRGVRFLEKYEVPVYRNDLSPATAPASVQPQA